VQVGAVSVQVGEGGVCSNTFVGGGQAVVFNFGLE
jgi:hypothetical protein